MSETPRTLRDYARHDDKCAWHGMAPCTCGLDALLSAPDDAPQEIERLKRERDLAERNEANLRLQLMRLAAPDAVRETPPAWAEDFDRRLQAKLTPTLNSGTAMELLVVVGDVLREMKEADR